MKRKLSVTALSMAFALAAPAQISRPVYLNPDAPVEARVQDALKRLTVHEKIKLIHAQSMFTSAGVHRLGIRQLNMSDGPHGVRAEVSWGSWNTAQWTNDSICAFPSLTCLAATWNRDLSGEYGHAVSEEFAFRGKDVLLGPGTTICRVPLNGRSFEYMGEDPCLAGEMAVPYIKRAQANGVACCLKHFALNNQEIDRFTLNVNVGERALREIYLPAFKKCVQQAGVWSIMGSYPIWNGEHMCHNDSLLNKILKKEWGFDGVVISDWGGCHDTWQAAMNGLDIEMGTDTDGKTEDRSQGFDSYRMANPLEKLIVEGRIPMSVLDDKAERVLRTIFRTAMNPRKVVGNQCSAEHYAVCKSIGAEGAVLLKNQNNILPIAPGRYKHILVVGDNAVRNMSEGGGSSELKTKFDISPLDGLRAVYGDRISFARGYYAGRPLYDEVDPLLSDSLNRLKAEALQAAKEADLIVFVGGLNKNHKQDCENGDRESYDLPYGQNELIAELAKVQKNIVVLTFGGNAFATPWINSVKGLMHCWYLGSMSGETLAELVSGKQNPSGKLPVTFAKREADYPCFQFGKRGYPGVDKQVYYDEGIYVGYRWFNTKGVAPQFPFGFGLSYTTFKYGKPVLSAQTMNRDGKITLSVPVTNTGRMAGKEVVELFVGDDKSSEDRPKKELKNFAKASLAPGETKTVHFDITREDLEYWSERTHGFVAEPGTFTAYVCASETDVRASARFELK
ncbi:glycoside hydrolase family 3 C-terminal domain-containing protein [Hallella seregens]|uniref:Glycoside hydrolase family 3 C-terminal domain-containing protein n=1 Tax=Hallella seregens ATCC 51272 TaxID=1336250 RepID=A0ABV5ZLU7_9BACT|nr:glycoside hydrolase family 3 C-terminal domain-containing protein [Hallella seregens]